MKFVIRAGGVGSRLWPMSRASAPKQFHSLVSDKTLIQETVDRLSSIAALSDIFISTNINSVDMVKKQLPTLSGNNIIIEPARRDTAAAVGLEAVFVQHAIGSDSVIASLGSDHIVKNAEVFCSLLQHAEAFLGKHPDYLLTLGIVPYCVETGYGHICKGEVLDKNFNDVLKVAAFKEKPEYSIAKKYTESGQYLWNGNMFVWRTDTILNLFKKFVPEMYAGLMRIKEALGRSDADAILQTEYAKLQKISIDYAIIEKTDKIAVLPADIGWTDIGNWKTLAEVLTTDKNNNLLKSKVVNVGSKNSLVYAPKDKLIGIIGLDNIVVVDTPNALLVSTKDRAQEVKKIVEKLEEQNRIEYL